MAMSSQAARILVVDDEEEIRWVLRELLEGAGMTVAEAADGETALSTFWSSPADVVLLDIRMPGMDGHELLRRLKQLDSEVPIVILTAFGTIPDAVGALKQGAYWYLTKPGDHREMLAIIHKALREGKRRRRQKAPIYEQLSLVQLMGQSQAVLRLAAEVTRVAPTEYSVAILGETGVGKELVARAIHLQSPRAAKEFVAVDSGAIPETLIESEFFGHEKGAFTSADRTRPGKFETAAGGTLFLDEISNLPVAMQAKLLRVLQERMFYRIGGTTPIQAEARILAASNQPLTARPGIATIRADLYHRLCEYVIHVPPLRERREDIPYLASRFLGATNEELGKNVTGFTESAIGLLVAYDWPGNVRELRNAIRGAALLAEEVVDAQDLASLVPTAVFPPPAAQPEALPLGKLRLRDLLAQQLAAVERVAFRQAFEVAGGNKAAVARLLRVDYKTVLTKAKKYNITEGGANNDRTTEKG